MHTDIKVLKNRKKINTYFKILILFFILLFVFNISNCTKKTLTPGITLFEAIKKGNIDRVEEFIYTEVDLNTTETNEPYNTPLNLAVYEGNLKIVKLLLKQKVDVNKSSSYWTPLHTSAYRGYSDILKLLIEAGASLEARSKPTNSTALNIAANNGKTECVKILIKSGASISNLSLDLFGNLAAMGHFETIKTLVDAGVSIGIEDGKQSLLFASQKCHTEIVKFLLLQQIDINSTDELGESALYKATSSGCEPVITILINSKADPNLKTKFGETALASALSHKNPSPTIIQILRKAVGDEPIK